MSTSGRRALRGRARRAENNPILDHHILCAITMVVLAAFAACDTWGLGRWWKQESLGRDYPVLR